MNETKAERFTGREAASDIFSKTLLSSPTSLQNTSKESESRTKVVIVHDWPVFCAIYWLDPGARSALQRQTGYLHKKGFLEVKHRLPTMIQSVPSRQIQLCSLISSLHTVMPGISPFFFYYSSHLWPKLGPNKVTTMQ